MLPLIRNNVTVTGNPAAARTIVFVNGLGTDQGYWSRLTPAFADDYRLVLFDHVGTTQANQAYFREKQLRYLNVKGYANDLLEICSALGLNGETVVIGHSLGAMTGLLASIDHPAQFRRLVLIGASPRYTDTADYRGGFTAEDIKTIYSAVNQDYAQWSTRLAAAAMGNPDSPLLTQRFADSILGIPPDMMLTILCSVLQTDHRDQLARVRVPTLLLHSRDDDFVPTAVAEYLHAHIPASTLVFVDAEGHLPHVSAPEGVIAAIGDFIAQP